MESRRDHDRLLNTLKPTQLLHTSKDEKQGENGEKVPPDANANSCSQWLKIIQFKMSPQYPLRDKFIYPSLKTYA